MRLRYAWAVALVALAWGCVVLALVLQFGFGVQPADPQTGSTDVVLGLAWPALALLVLRQQPANRLIWIFLVIGVGMGLFLAGTDLAVVLARNGLPGAVAVDWLGVGAGEFAWPLLTGLLIGVYLGLVSLSTQVLAFGSSLSAALATLAAAALFQPLRRVLQEAVDRRFHRARYDALARVEEFAGRLRTPVSTEAIAGDLLDVVDRTVQPASATLWLVRSTG